MTREPAGPFGPGPEDGREGHLVLENAGGRRSLWPAWRAVPSGWTSRFGPAPYERCVRRVAAGREWSPQPAQRPSSSTSPSASSVRQQR
ncbi:MbtH family protein [Streptomyces pimonensis]|uniref:MbtH family protein n=1 Tax=Streptomyces pimonensis TaxID=2860288 RepID=A0ABV4IY63_9ACTN